METLDAQKKEYKRLRENRKKKYEADMAKYGVVRTGSGGGGGDDNDSTTLGGRSRRSKMSQKSTSSVMSSSVTLSLCEASISPYAVNTAAPYPKRFMQLREQLKHMRIKQNVKSKKNTIPESWTMEAEAFRDEILGVQRSNKMWDDSSMAASSISGDSLSVGNDILLEMNVSVGNVNKMKGKEKSKSGGDGKPPLATAKAKTDSKAKTETKDIIMRPQKSAKLKVQSEGKAPGKGNRKTKKIKKQTSQSFVDEDVYGDDFEGGEEFPVVISSFDGGGGEEGGGEEEVGDMDFFNSEIVSDLPIEDENIDVYGDDFEGEDAIQENDFGEGKNLILASAPPPGHFSGGSISRPNTSGGSDGRPMSTERLRH